MSRSPQQSHLRFPLTNILGSPGNVRVLRALVLHRPPQSVAQLGQEAGLTPPGTRLVLESLTREKIVTAHGSGRTLLYTLTPTHPLTGALIALFEQEQRYWDTLLKAIRDALQTRSASIDAAWLYGSVARGADSVDSDIDIAVVVRSPEVADQIREDMMPLEDRHRVRISVATLTTREFSALPENDPWWSSVVRDGRILKGPAPEQARRRLARTGA